MKISFIADTINFTVAASLECLSCLGNILFILLLYYIILYYLYYYILFILRTNPIQPFIIHGTGYFSENFN